MEYNKKNGHPKLVSIKGIKINIQLVVEKNTATIFNSYDSIVEFSWTLFHKKKVKECRPNAQTPQMLFEEI